MVAAPRARPDCHAPSPASSAAPVLVHPGGAGEPSLDLSIGELAERTGVPAKTIRYYEQIGLLRAPSRAGNGYRRYGARALHELSFVKRARDLGFSLDDVARLLALWRDKKSSREVKALAEHHVAAVERKIAELDGLRQTLLHLVHRCAGDNRPDCPILDDLAEGPIAGRFAAPVSKEPSWKRRTESKA